MVKTFTSRAHMTRSVHLNEVNVMPVIQYIHLHRVCQLTYMLLQKEDSTYTCFVLLLLFMFCYNLLMITVDGIQDF